MFYDMTWLERILFLKRIKGGASYIIETLSGTSPLSIVDALQSRIMSLIQYGKCVQDATPTPTSPVPIKINNGTLKMIDDELPSGYKRIKSIDFDGDFWYDTAEKLLGSDNVTMTLGDTATGGQNVFGSYNGTASGVKNFSLYLYGGGSSSNCYLRYGSQLVRPRYGSGERTLTFGKDGTSGFLNDVTIGEDTFETEATAFIGMLPNSSSPAYTGKIIGDIFISNRLRYIPCENPNGVIGYYEVVKGTFISPIGTGTPIAGEYDHSHDKVIFVDGTPEVLSVTSQTASVADLYSVADYEDEQNIISGAIMRKVGIKILDGTESGWALSVSGTTNRFRGIKPSDCYTPSSRAPSVSTHFKYLSTGSAVGGMFIGASAYWYFILTDQTIDTVEGWTAWLAEQYAAGTPVIVLYPLVEPVEESVSAQPLMLAEGNNTLTATAEVSGIEFEVKYKKSAI